ncbi:FG-GAP-like repeat-containing protein [Nocardioides sp. BYT-33-1]|uniref:FG-GAP-like repeat-containing protein n=1 Tax=Nocardioides sp. BYT-33-1 TaxID=3416952 RepID=UPI003F53D6F6
MSKITPPGWYPDGDGWERRWDGDAWTDDRRQMTRFAPADESTRARSTTPPATTPPATTPPATSYPVPVVHPQPSVHQPFPPSNPPQSAAPPAHPAAPAPSPAAWPPSPGTGALPPAYGALPSGPSGPSVPSGPSAPSGQRRGRLGLWIALAVLLVLLAATTGALAALRPWAEDTPSATEGGGGGGGGGADGADRPAAIQGDVDVDGDGNGDAIYYFSPDYDSTRKITAASNGTVFTTSELAVEEASEPDELHLDWDRDGANEVLTWSFVDDANQLTLSSSDREFPGDQTFRLQLSSLKEFGVRIQVQPGDFDGDGAVDLAVAGPNDRVVDVQVLLGDGAGGFAEPVRWAALTNATVDSTEIRAGDFDHDGRTDLWARVPAERLADEDYSGYYSGDQGYAMLTSTGSDFEVGAVFESGIYADAYLIGDVTGDGTTNLVTVEASSYDEALEVKVYDLATGRPREVVGFTGSSTIGKRSLQGATLSDVDGDGDGDVVFVVKALQESKFTGVQVMRSTGTAFEPATVWAETPPCDSADCRIEFPGS